MKKIVILLIALMVISVGFLSGCTENSNTNELTNEDEDNPYEGMVYIEMEIELGTSGAFIIEEDGLYYIQCYANVKNNEKIPTPEPFWVKWNVKQLHYDYQLQAEKILQPNVWVNLTSRTQRYYNEDIYLQSVGYDRPCTYIEEELT